MPLRALSAAGAVLILIGCTTRTNDAAQPRRPAAVPQTSTTVPVPTSTATTVPAAPEFAFSVAPIDGDVRARVVGSSWRAGCPVALEDLRYIQLGYWSFDGDVRVGELIVHLDVTADVEAIFGALFEARFPIHSMRLVDDFGADDFASIEADNTSAFNCRTRTGTSGEWSQHAFGRAIDMNPIENPYVSTAGSTAHPASRAYLDRTNVRPGMMVAGDAAVTAFASRDWGWGGFWSPPVDYQHFSHNGR